MIRTLLALAAACALALPAGVQAAEPAKAPPPATKPAEAAKEAPKEQPKEAASEPPKGPWDADKMGFGKPPPVVGKMRPDSLLNASMKAALEAPVGANDCESAYNGIKAMFDTLKKMNYEPALRREMPKREPWIAQCKQHPPALQKCLVIKYQLEHQGDCEKAIDEYEGANPFESDASHGQSVPDHKH